MRERADSSAALLRRVSSAMFWNSAMLPAITAVNLGAAVMVRRGFGLESGVYDIGVGLLNTLLTHAAFGVPTTIGQFAPALDRTAGRAAVRAFVAQVTGLRLSVLTAVLVPLNLLAAPVAEYLGLGAGGGWLVHLVSCLAVLRAISDLAIKTLQALLAHFVANLVQLAQALALVAVVAWTLVASESMPGLFVGLAAASVPVSIGAAWVAWRATRGAADSPGAATTGVPRARVWGFALFMYSFEASNYFATPAFASIALAATDRGLGAVATFNVAFQVPMMIVTMLLAGFQGLYRPLFSGVMADGALGRVRTAFAEISKVQAILLVPAAVGLGLLAPDYIRLLFTSQFVGAGDLARIFTALLFLEALFNLGSIVLSVDRRYALTVAAQAFRFAGAATFVWFATRGDMLTASLTFGAGRVLAALVAYRMARHLYDVQFPWGFALRVALATLPMALVVGVGRLVVPVTWTTAALLTVTGVLLTVWGVRVFRVASKRETDLLRRSGLPGHERLAGWLERR